jgi:hypothetical protein
MEVAISIITTSAATWKPLFARFGMLGGSAQEDYQLRRRSAPPAAPYSQNSGKWPTIASRVEFDVHSSSMEDILPDSGGYTVRQPRFTTIAYDITAVCDSPNGSRRQDRLWNAQRA